jgi:hypothetical protein
MKIKQGNSCQLNHCKIYIFLKLDRKKISCQKLEDNKKTQTQTKTKIYKGFFFNSVSSIESRWTMRGYVCLFDLG